MIATIAKRFTFDAAHQLPHCPEGHKCRRLHGHTYTVEVTLVGPVDPATGFVVDYDQIGKAWDPIHALIDHQYLNDVPGLECPSTEVLAAWLVKKLVDESEHLIGVPMQVDPHWDPSDPHGHSEYLPTTLVTQVRVDESSSTWCTVRVLDCHTKRKPWVSLR